VPLPISLAICWTIWTVTSFSALVILLKFAVGSTTSGLYPLNSFYYLHKLWLRQLIISSFHHSLDFIPLYDVLPSIILRWLGAYIADNVKFAEFQQILHFPSNLLSIECGVTTFGGVKLVSFEMTKEGLCYIDKIQLGSETNLGNWCTLMPGTRLSSNIFVGSLTLITRKTINGDSNSVLLGIPAHEMPFVLRDNVSVVNDLSPANTLFTQSLYVNCISFFINKCLFLSLYLLMPVFVAPFIHLILVCTIHHYSISKKMIRAQFTYSEVITRTGQFVRTLMTDFFTFFGSYMSGTQYLVLLFRALGAQIGCDVILSDINCITDPHLTTIGDHVRLNIGAHVQVRYFL
jgi:hypothetical protein